MMESNRRHFALLIAAWLSMASIMACRHERHPAPEPERAGKNHAVIADWTAGIVSDRSRLPAKTFALIQDVRAAKHAQFDRIVFEFAPPGIPGYHLAYIDAPVRECGSGKAVHLPGDGWLMIKFLSARMHRDGSTVTRRSRNLGLPVLLRLVTTCDFENVVTWVAAVSAPNRFRVLSIENPPRLVIDIRH